MLQPQPPWFGDGRVFFLVVGRLATQPVTMTFSGNATGGLASTQGRIALDEVVLSEEDGSRGEWHCSIRHGQRSVARQGGLVVVMIE